MAKTAHQALSTQKLSQAKKVSVNTQVSTQEKDLNQHELNQSTIAGLSAAKKNALVADQELISNQKHTENNVEHTSHSDAQADADVAVLADVDQNYGEIQSELAKFDASWNETQTSSVMGNVVASAAHTYLNPWLIGAAAVGAGAAIAIASSGGDDNNNTGIDWEHQAFNYMDGLNIADVGIKTDVGASSATVAYIEVTDGLTRAQALNYVNNMNTVQGGHYAIGTSFSFSSSSSSSSSFSTYSSGDFDITAKGGIINMVGTLENVYAQISASSTTSDGNVILANTIGIENTNTSQSTIQADIAIYAYAYTNSDSTDAGDAEVAINHLYIDIEAEDNASASIDTISAYATGNGVARIEIGDININALATAVGGDARATVSDIDAFAYDNATATVLIDSINVTAEALDQATASFYSLTVSAHDNGIARVEIGDITVKALSTGAGGDAAATFSSISASAYDNGSATVILGNVNVTAEAEDYASASLGSISATAYDNGTASITIGDIHIKAESQTGDAYISMTDIAANAYDHASVNVTVGNITLEAIAHDANDYAYVSNDSSQYAYAEDNATANLVIGDMTLKALSEDGYATVSGYYDKYAEAYNHGVANATFGNIVYSAEGATSAQVFASESFYANAFGYGVANLTVGDMTYNAHNGPNGSASADATASFTSAISASATGYGVATVTIGDLSILATAEDSAYATYSTTYFAAFAYGQGEATLNAGDVLVHAVGGGSASAYMSAYISATGDGVATVNLGNLTVQAEGVDYAYAAANGNFYAYAYYEGLATINAGDIAVMATAASGSASADFNYLSAYASYNGEASIDVGSITVQAEGSVDSFITGYVSAYFDSVYAYASSAGIATVNVNGDIRVSAMNNLTGGTSGDAYVSISSINAGAGDVGVATVNINGDVYLTASASDYAQAKMYVSAYASSQDSEAIVNIGDINLTATGEDSYAWFEAYVYGNSYSGIEEINLGNITMAAEEVSLSLTNDNAYDDLHPGSLNVGNIDITLAESGDTSGYASVYIRNVDYDASRSLTITGGADSSADIYLDSQNDNNLSVGRIDLTDMADADVQLQIGTYFSGYDNDNSNFGDMKYSTIYGWDALDASSSIQFGNVAVVAGNFDDLNTTESSLSGLWTALNSALDGTDEYVFTQINEVTAGDVNGDGYTDTHLGVLAYDEDGTGVSGLLFFSDQGGGANLSMDDTLTLA